jgi:hypothetical protein
VLIRERTSPEDRIAVVGSEPEIYFYAARPAATGYIYTYEMMNDHEAALGFQREMAAEIEGARPTYLVYVNDPASWYATYIKPNDAFIFEWAWSYIAGEYRRLGIVELDTPPAGERTACWDQSETVCRPLTERWMALYQRRT